MDNSEYCFLDSEYKDGRFELHLKIPSEMLVNTYKRRLDQLIATQPVNLPGFRPGKAPRHLIEQKFSARAAKDTIDGHLENALASAIEKEGYTGLGEVDARYTPWDRVSDVEAVVTIPAWKLIKIDLEKVKSGLAGETLPAERQELRKIVLDKLMHSHSVAISADELERFKSLSQVSHDPSMSGDEFQKRIVESLLLDSLVYQLKIETGPTDEREKLAELAVTMGVSMLEVEQFLENTGSTNSVRIEVRRDRALDRLSELCR